MDTTFPHRRSEQRQAKRAGTGTSKGFELAASTTSMSVSPLSGNEKDLLHGLNGRLAGFIDKVHQLERHNQLLEKEIEEIKGRAQSVSSLEEQYGPELRRLRQLVRDIAQQKHHIEIEHRSLEEELSILRKRHEKEARSRSDAESNIMVLKRDIDDAYQAKLQLDKKVKLLVDEVQCLKQSHGAEVSEMIEHIQHTEDTFKAREFGNPVVTAALRDIRTQLEGHVGCDAHRLEETFRSQFAKLTEAAESKRESLRASQQEIHEYRRQLQAKDVELDCAKGTREALEKQLCEAEDHHKQELLHYQDTIKQLENELINCKFDMSGYLREYQDLLNVKMALDVEILSYRKLLCGEEARLSSVTGCPVSLPYIYHQSPVYTLPCVNRPGGTHRRPEPQYKFVEEIITETMREIVMSDFEDTGPEESEDQQCSKRDGGGGEEEDYYSKDSGEDGDERDSQQDQGGRIDGESCNENVERCQKEPPNLEESAGEKVNGQNLLEITAEKVGLVSLDNNQKSQEVKAGIQQEVPEKDTIYEYLKEKESASVEEKNSVDKM